MFLKLGRWQHLIGLRQPLQHRLCVVTVSDAPFVGDLRPLAFEKCSTGVAFRAVVVGVARHRDALRIDANGADDAVARDAFRTKTLADERFWIRSRNLARIEPMTNKFGCLTTDPRSALIDNV